MKFKQVLFVLSSLFLVSSCAEESETTLGVEILTGISQDPELSTLSTALTRANLRSQLEGTQYTFFAPTNQAFTDAGVDVNAIDPATLSAILKYHMVPTRLDGSRLDVEYGKFVGIITPSTTISANYLGNLTYLGVQTLNLGVNANVYYTQAIEVVNNSVGTLNLEGFYVNGGRVTEIDAFEGGDGVVHKIDRLLLPPSGSAAFAISADPDLSLFDKLVKKASVNANGIPSFSLSVLDVLPANALAVARTGTFTVLAPTNAAMTAAGYTSAGIDALTVAQCLTIARQHVVNLRWFSPDLRNQLIRNNPAQTTFVLAPLAGANITYNNTGSAVFFSTTTTPTIDLVSRDIVLTNGVLHKVSTVIQ
jgi:uncharacterized surface protein with fasciclin (FAS1) repeats